MNGSMRSTAVALLLALLALSCASKPPAAHPGGAGPLPFIENDFPQALTKAREANLPLFVEVWAPW